MKKFFHKRALLWESFNEFFYFSLIRSKGFLEIFWWYFFEIMSEGITKFVQFPDKVQILDFWRISFENFSKGPFVSSFS